MPPSDDGEAFLRRINTVLGDAASDALTVAAEMAERAGHPLYLVGGTVRDVLLGTATKDVDLAVVGDAQPFGAQLAAATGGKVTGSSQFGTVALRVGGVRVDIVTARRERYASPGALPQIAPSTIDDDLLRRDFSVNAIGFGLAGQDRMRFRDPAGGFDDLSRGMLSVLHPASFQDDPTRMLRAARYAARLGFSLANATRGWLTRDAGFLTRVSGARRGQELRRILAEAEPERALALVDQWGLLEVSHPGLALPAGMAGLFEAARARSWERGGLEEVYLCLMLSRLSGTDRRRVAQDLQFPARWRRALSDFNAIAASIPQLDVPNAAPSMVVAWLTGRASAAVGAWTLLADEPARSWLRAYEERWRFVRPLLGAEDVERIGGLRHAALGACLTAIRSARLDGKIETVEDEVAMVKAWAQAAGSDG